MTVSIDNLSIQANAASGTKIGALAAFDPLGMPVSSVTFDLCKDDSGLFAVTAGNLVSNWGAAILPGYYAVNLAAIQNSLLVDQAWFSVNVIPATYKFVTSVITGSLRNDFTSWLGMRITVGSTPLVVSALGRWVVSGNSQVHPVKIVTASTGADLPGGSVTVITAGKQPSSFSYANLASPVTLAAGVSYYIVSSETQGGDLWGHDADGTLTTTNVATGLNSVYFNVNAYVLNLAGHAYVPVDFIYA